MGFLTPSSPKLIRSQHPFVKKKKDSETLQVSYQGTEQEPGRQLQTGLLMCLVTRGQGSLTIVPESPRELVMLVFRVKKERAPRRFLNAFYDCSLSFGKTRKMKLLCTHR